MKQITEPTKRRLVLLKHLLAAYPEKNITSQKIAELAGWSAAVVRRDISQIDIRCGASNGYKVADLEQSLDELLNLSQVQHKCCIVGLGRMGQALLDNIELDSSPFKIAAGFDSNVNRTEVLHSAFPLHPTTMLESVIKEEHIQYALMTVEVSEAQSIATRLAVCGIRGIVNYAPCMISVPETTKVENVSLLMSLETLSARISC